MLITTDIKDADSLNSATTNIDIRAATAPITGQVLTATSSTAATWQTPVGATAITLATARQVATLRV